MARLKLIVPATIPLLLAILSACTVGPDYVKPKADTPASYKEVEGWKKANPRTMFLAEPGGRYIMIPS